MFSSLFSGVASVIQQAMGNHYSVFVRALKRGDAAAAVDMYNRKKSVRESIKPNELSGDTQANTILHHLAKLNMISVYNELLLTGNAIPDMKNNQRENCLHLICQGPGKQAVKANMLGATIDVFGLHGMDLHHVLSEKDQVPPHTPHTHTRNGWYYGVSFSGWQCSAPPSSTGWTG